MLNTCSACVDAHHCIIWTDLFRPESRDLFDISVLRSFSFQQTSRTITKSLFIFSSTSYTVNMSLRLSWNSGAHAPESHGSLKDTCASPGCFISVYLFVLGTKQNVGRCKSNRICLWLPAKLPSRFWCETISLSTPKNNSSDPSSIHLFQSCHSTSTLDTHTLIWCNRGYGVNKSNKVKQQHRNLQLSVVHDSLTTICIEKTCSSSCGNSKLSWGTITSSLHA